MLTVCVTAGLRASTSIWLNRARRAIVLPERPDGKRHRLIEGVRLDVHGMPDISAKDATVMAPSASSATSAPKPSWSLVKTTWTVCTCRWRRPRWYSSFSWKAIRIERGAAYRCHHTTILKLLVLASEKCERVMG